MASKPYHGPVAWRGLLNRRDLLRMGAVGIAAAACPQFMSQASPASDSDLATTAATARSVILLFMSGGVTHIDSFDPKPDAPAEIRGTLGAISTTVPGIQFCETLPNLAGCAEHLAVVRTFAHDSNDHFIGQAHCLSGRRVTAQQTFSEPNIGSIVSKLQGPRRGMPGYVAAPGTTRAGAERPFTGGWIGSQYDPFCTGGLQPQNIPEEVLHLQGLQYAPSMTESRLARRRAFRQHLAAGAAAGADSARADVLAGHYSAAFDLMLSSDVRQAFDLRQEADTVRDAYGRTKIGQRCLLARRLVEAGAPFVMVDYGVDYDSGNTWDNHNAPGQNHPPICEIVRQPYHLAGTDRAFAALINDLHERGRLSETLVVFLTEFGRTPRINADGGRDHWCWTGSIFFAGGGTRGGQCLGATDPQGAYPITASYSPGDVAATIYRAIGIDTEQFLLNRQSRPMPLLPEGTAIAGVL